MKIIIHMGDAYRDELPTGKRMRVFYETFIAHGHDVKLLAPKAEKRTSGKKDVIECAVIPLKKKTVFYRILNGVSFGITSVLASLKAGQADVVLTTSPPPLISLFGWLIAKIKRAALIYDVRDIWPDVAWEMGSFDRDSAYSRLFSFIRNFMLRHADFITTVSKGKVEKLKEYEPNAQVLNIANGFDTHFLQYDDLPNVADRYGMDEQFTCVYVGNIGLAQGLKQLLQIAERAKEQRIPVRFLLFGGGSDEEHLKKYAYDHGLENVVFVGCVPSAQVYTVLKHAKMCFVPLVNERLTDSIPTKLYEALGSGCPVLLSAVGESVDILHECGLGMSVPPGNFNALWNAFMYMYHNIEQFLEYRESTQKLMKTKYSRQSIAEFLETELQKRLGDK